MHHIAHAHIAPSLSFRLIVQPLTLKAQLPDSLTTTSTVFHIILCCGFSTGLIQLYKKKCL